MRRVTGIAAALVLAAAQARSETAPAPAPPAATGAPPVAAAREEAGEAQEAEEAGWSFSASAYTYVVPDDHDYVQPTVTADRDWLHLEARYNYEALETGSTWAGYNLSGGEKVGWEFTPMLGGVFGEANGIAPGYKGWLGWWKLELYSEGEYVFDLGDTSESFFYSWSELSLAPVDWLRFGLAGQRTRVYETDREIQRGLLVGFSHRMVELTTYVFNPDESEPTVVVAVAATF